LTHPPSVTIRATLMIIALRKILMRASYLLLNILGRAKTQQNALA
jgi:hypothetical protein